jgi:hypothetical protein
LQVSAELEEERLAHKRADEEKLLSDQMMSKLKEGLKDVSSHTDGNAMRAADASKISNLEKELQKEKEKRRRAEEELKNLVEDMDELTADVGPHTNGVQKY